MMPKFLDRGEVAEDVVVFTTIQHGDETKTGTRAAFEAREVTDARITSDLKTQDGTPVAPTQDRSTSISQNGWHGGWGWGSGAGPWSRPWDGIPTTIATLASTVIYTEPPPTAQMSQLSSLGTNASETRTDGMNISGPAAAGIGVGASIGFLGICLVAICSYRKLLRRRKSLYSSVEMSGDVKTTRDTLWPPYPYSASNESPVELSAIRQPKEMSAETSPREKDASNHSEIAELNGEWQIMRRREI